MEKKIGEFVFFSIILSNTINNVDRRLAVAATVFGRIWKTIWTRRDIHIQLEMGMYNAHFLFSNKKIESCGSLMIKGVTLGMDHAIKISEDL